MIDKLKADSGLAIKYEEDFAGFLGVLLKKNDDRTITLSRTSREPLPELLQLIQNLYMPTKTENQALSYSAMPAQLEC